MFSRNTRPPIPRWWVVPLFQQLSSSGAEWKLSDFHPTQFTFSTGFPTPTIRNYIFAIHVTLWEHHFHTGMYVFLSENYAFVYQCDGQQRSSVHDGNWQSTHSVDGNEWERDHSCTNVVCLNGMCEEKRKNKINLTFCFVCTNNFTVYFNILWYLWSVFSSSVL